MRFLLLPIFVGFLFSCSKEGDQPDLIIRLSSEQVSQVVELIDHPGWLTEVELDDIMQAAGIIFHEEDRIILNDGFVTVYGGSEFQSDARKFFGSLDEYETFLRDLLESPPEWQ